jgi:ferrous iron transport protein B
MSLDKSSEIQEVLRQAQDWRWKLGGEVHERFAETLYAEASGLAGRAVSRPGEKRRFDLDRTIDRVVTSRLWGIPLMVFLFSLVFWITISAANVPSGFLGWLLVDEGHAWLSGVTERMGLPWWLKGVLVDGVYLATAWVIAVMLPPMAIFFPLFTLLEDFGYLPRVAFNLDNVFRRAGAHGKQALSMMMGFGCNAAGVVATRIIDSPRERLIAMVTNNFALCNGRWPTQILVASLFIGTLVPGYLGGLVSAMAVVGVALLGVGLSLVVSWMLSRTVLKGEVSAFSLELPPYRPPRFWQTLYTSLVDRTVFVLWRAVVFAVPAGVVIWLVANVHLGGVSIAEHVVGWLDPLGVLLGLNGVILLAYIIAIPANEIVVPTVLMLTVLTVRELSGLGAGAGVMFELDSGSDTYRILAAGGWSVLTGVNLMLFSLLHNPCSTTLYTIYKESGSWKWMVISALLPLGMGFGVTFFVAQIWRLCGG